MTGHRARDEQQLQKNALAHIAWRAVPGVWFCHYPAGGWRSAVEAAILKGLGVVAGVPDLLLVHRGQLYALELKTERGRLTQIQIATQTTMRAAGAKVATAAGLDAALEQLEAWGLLRPNRSSSPPSQSPKREERLRTQLEQASDLK
jgi:hypothetical protein